MQIQGDNSKYKRNRFHMLSFFLLVSYGTIYYTYVRGRKFVVKKSKVVVPIMVVVAVLATMDVKLRSI